MRQPPRNPLSERIQFNKNSLWPDTENLLGGYNLEKCDTYRNFRDLFLEMKNADIGITPQIKDFREHSTFLTILISPLGNRVASPKVVRSLPVSQTRQSIFMLMPIVPKKFDKLRLGGGTANPANPAWPVAANAVSLECSAIACATLPALKSFAMEARSKPLPVNSKR